MKTHFLLLKTLISQMGATKSSKGKIMKQCLFVVCLFLAINFAHAAKPKQVVIGFNPAENVEVIETNGKLFGDYYKKRTGVDVKTFIATDYTALIEAMRSGKVDFAWLPPFSFVKAEQIAKAEVLLKSVRKGRSHFYSAIITRADKNFKTIEDLRGKNIAWTDPSSTAGHIFPKANLKTNKGINVDTFFGKQVFAGAHDSLVLSVLNGTVDAGATFCNDKEGTDGAWTQFLKGDDVKKIKVVFVSDPIPGDTMATTSKFRKEHGSLVDETVKIMLEMGKSDEGKKILQALYRLDAMEKATSRDYDPVRAAAKVADVL